MRIRRILRDRWVDVLVIIVAVVVPWTRALIAAGAMPHESSSCAIA